MELIKPKDNLEFKWRDVTFFYRGDITVGDRYRVLNSGNVMDGDKIMFRPWDLYKTLIETLVVGWTGVTENGKSIPYSFDTLMNKLPADMTTDIVSVLGLEIAKKTGFFSGEDNAKVESLKKE